MFFVILSIFLILALSKETLAWGACTHLELAQSLLSQAASIGGAISWLLIVNRKNFLLGNIFADVIIGKKLSKRRHKAHQWHAGMRIVQNAKNEAEIAFGYGFLTHLAADTVAHNEFVPNQILLANSTISLGHLYWELRADRYVNSHLRRKLPQILRQADATHDKLLSENIYPHLKLFRVNRQIFSKINRLAAGENFNKAMNICENFSLWEISDDLLGPYKQKSIDRMADIVINGAKSKILHEDPNGLITFELLRSSFR